MKTRWQHPKRPDHWIELWETVAGYRGTLHYGKEQFHLEGSWAFASGLSFSLAESGERKRAAQMLHLPETWIVISGHWQY